MQAENSGYSNISIITRNSQGELNRSISLDDIQIKLNRWGGREVCIKGTNLNLGLSVNDLIKGLNNSIEQGKLSHNNQIKLRSKLKEFTEVKDGHIPGMEKASKGQIFLHFFRSLFGNTERKAQFSKLDEGISLSHQKELKMAQETKLKLELLNLEKGINIGFSEKDNNTYIIHCCNENISKLQKLEKEMGINGKENNSKIKDLMKLSEGFKLNAAKSQSEILRKEIDSLSLQIKENSFQTNFMEKCKKNLLQLTKIKKEVDKISSDDFKFNLDNLIKDVSSLQNDYIKGPGLFKEAVTMKQEFANAGAEMYSVAMKNDSLQKSEDVECRDVIEFLKNINNSMLKIDTSASSMRSNLDIIKKNLPQEYEAKTENNKKAFDTLFDVSLSMHNAIIAYSSDCKWSFYEALGSETNKKSFSEGMTVKMNNILLNCNVKLTSEEELRQLNDSCDKYIALLDKIHDELKEIYPKVPRGVIS